MKFSNEIINKVRRKLKANKVIICKKKKSEPTEECVEKKIILKKRKKKYKNKIISTK